MQRTEKYFEQDAFRTQCESIILAAEPDEKTGGGRIALDGTVFYPEGGGQPADQGTLTLTDGTVLRISVSRATAGMLALGMLQPMLVVLAAALMIYALVWGDEAASRTFRASILRAVVVCSLGFYCLAKSYSFFTGANHLHSIISPGTPGNILSGGLILPLNVAVGLVVCCTMYSFYMYFRRGEL